MSDDLLSVLFSKGFISKVKYNIFEDHLKPPFLLFKIKGTDIFLEVMPDGTREISKYNHYWIKRLNIMRPLPYNGYYNEWKEISIEDVISELNKNNKKDLVELLLFNIDCFV